LGSSAWLYDGAFSVSIGLNGDAYIRTDGFSSNSVVDLNGTGQVIGYASRWNGGSTYLGQDAWHYDPVQNQTIPLQLSVRSDGYAYSNTEYLGEDGLVVGTYQLFDSADNDLGKRAFSFTVDNGLHDLGSLVDLGLPANDWDFLADAIRANALGQIIGHGKPTSQSDGQMAYLLTPINSLPGDFNHDGTVDAADYVIWRKTGGLPEDFTAWRKNFGSTVGGGSTSKATVPEPAAALFLVLGAVIVCQQASRNYLARSKTRRV
jgi:hypothetical protein